MGSIRLNIAVCDDEENIRYLIKRLIEKQDASCRIMEFSSGEELLRFWEQEDREQLDILFLDISTASITKWSISFSTQECGFQNSAG